MGADTQPQLVWEPQANVHWPQVKDSRSRMTCLSGSVRSGKTILANLRWMGDMAKEYTSGTWRPRLMVGKTERTLERNILEPLRKATAGAFDYSRGSGQASFLGNPIDLVGANDERAESKIRGSTYYAAYVDEWSLIPESFHTMLLSRLSMHGAYVIGTTNPDSPFHYLKENYLDRAGEADMDITHIQFQLEDNTTLDPKYIRNLKAEYTGLWYRRFILGQWVQAAGAVYDMWEPKKHVRRMKPDFRYDGHFVSIDYGTSNPCTFGLYGYWLEDDGRPHVHLIKEYYYDGRDKGQKTDSEYADDLMDFAKGHPTYLDPSAASFAAELRKRGVHVIPGANDVLDGIRVVSSFLHEGRYSVDPACTMTIREYTSYIWDERAQLRGEDKPMKEHDHTCDRDRYGIYTRFGQERPLAGGRMVTL